MTFEDVTAPPSRKRIAWHEAGHAVTAWVQGFTVVLVSIRPEGESFGRSEHTPTGDCSIDSERHRENIVAMGGWAAELDSGEMLHGMSYDRADLSCLAGRAPEGRFEMELGSAEEDAVRIVRSNLERVARLAGVLLERTELTDAAEIKAIIEG